MTRFRTQGLDHVALVVADMRRSIAWYADVLGMERRYADVWDGGGHPVVLCNGDACVALFEPVEGDLVEADGVNRHFAIRLDRSGFDAARAELAEPGIEAELWDPTICHSLYVRDPDGHQVELTTYDLR
jgi:catechol 2,3-dioxygenase-like lactoylglutathione lyase family enzyme